LTSTATLPGNAARTGMFSGLDRWLHVMPHPAPVIEIGPVHIAAAQWDGQRLRSYAVEPLEAGALMPSPVETNVTQPDTVRRALERVFSRVPNLAGPVALLVPDPVVRVFILPFEDLPRRAEDALPLLRWRLKKSVPFDVEETAVSWSRQTARQGALEVVAAVSRQSIVREYESLVEGFDTQPNVVLSSTLATLPLVAENGSTLLMRMSGRTLTTAIVRGATLCLYRSTEMTAVAAQLDPKWALEEVFPAAAYYQDTWGESIDRALLAGFQGREDLLQAALQNELKIAARPLASGEGAVMLDRSAQDLMQQGLDPLVGWMANEGA
jgi:type IV pilus assembly protein PilM